MTTKQYQTNDMTSLKREALVNKDVETLQSIRAYDEHLKSRRYFYVRENEDLIRDNHGLEIDQSELPFPKDENSLHFATVGMVHALTSEEDQPGDLMRDIHFVMHRDLKTSAVILEVPLETVFPVLGGFGWWVNICADYIASGKYKVKHPSLNRRRLNGGSNVEKQTHIALCKNINAMNGRSIFDV